MVATEFAELPVCIDLPRHLAAEVTAFAEAEAGWHVVGADGPLLPVLTLATAVVPGRATVVVTDGGADVRDALLAGAVDVVVWPQERERLLRAPARLRAPVAVAAAVPRLVVGACRGGVGASTVALTVAACVAWAGGRALCVGGEDLLRLCGLAPWKGPGRAEVAALGAQAAGEIGAVARPVDGVPGLSVLGGPGPVPECAGWPYDVVVVDGGVGAADGAQVLIGARDAAAASAARAGAVLVVDHGPLERRAVVALLGREPDAWLPYSRRVARAGSAGRVPSSLPGSWVAAVRDGLAGALR